MKGQRRRLSVARFTACVSLLGMSTAVSSHPAVSAPAAPSGAAQPQLPVIVSFAINDTATTVRRTEAVLHLAHAVAGAKPVEYRVSARADFANALWLPYSSPLNVTGWQGLVPSGAKCAGGSAEGQRLVLFLQVRAELGSAVNIVNGQRVVVAQKVESNVISDAICVVGDH